MPATSSFRVCNQTRYNGRRDSEDKMTTPAREKHLSQRTTNILLAVSVIILVATVVIRYTRPEVPQEAVLVAMGVGVFLFLLVAFDQPD